ncbi:MAG TPA: hypothetical protein VMT17_11140 [Anaeromyxobacteraceae bacterium]|nr:hypothetical protein [Anaeromyxobacteraceae bacterium]
MPLALVVRASVPPVDEEHPEYWKFTVAPAATFAAAGVDVHAGIASGVTAFTFTPPEFFTARTAVKNWFVSTTVRFGVRVPVSAPACCTTTGAEAVLLDTDAPLFRSVPLALVDSVRVWTVPLEQPVNWKLTVAPPAMSWAAGVPVQAAMAFGCTPVAVAPPEFLTESVAVKTCPVLTVEALGVSVAARLGGVWTVTVAVALPVETTRVTSLPSVPEAEADRASVGVVVVEHWEYVKVTGGTLGSEVGGTSAGAGVTAQYAMVAGFTAVAFTWPLLVTTKVRENFWPVVTMGWLGVRVAESVAGTSTSTAP